MTEHIDVLLLTTPRPPHLSPGAVQVSENSAPPLGLLCVAAALEQAGFSVAVHDFYQLGGKPADVADLVQELRPRIVGVSTLTSGIHLALRVCAHVKRVAPDVVTVLGGPHATALPEKSAADPSVDVAVRGEGERTMVELAEALLRRGSAQDALQRISGLAVKVGDRVALTLERSVMTFDEAPWPARH
jgi:anaerobic magnesium-protoporphyrin IX monomethyl ester cyclase